MGRRLLFPQFFAILEASVYRSMSPIRKIFTMNSVSVKIIIREILLFGFYCFSLYHFFHPFRIDFGGEGMFVLRLTFLLLIIPITYLFRIAYALNFGDSLVYFFSALFKTEIDNENILFQVNLFHRAFYWMIAILAFGETLQYLFK